MRSYKKIIKNISQILIYIAFIALIVCAFQTKDEHVMLSCYAISGFLFFLWIVCCILKWLFKKEQQDKNNTYQRNEIEINMTDKEKKILRLQVLSFLLSFGLAVSPSMMILSPTVGKYTVFLWLGSWLLSVLSSIICVCLLNWKNLWSVLCVALFFPPVWFLICALGVAFSSKQTSDTEVTYGFLVQILIGFLVYFGLILTAEGFSKTEWKKLF